MTSKDIVFVEGIKCQVRVGETEEERNTWQPCLVDIEVTCDLKKAGESDSLDDTVNYVQLYKIVEETAKTKLFNLLEAFCEWIAMQALKDPKAATVRIRARKRHPPVSASAKSFGIEIYRTARTQS